MAPYPNWGRESSSAAPIAANAVDIATLNASQAVQDPLIAANTAAVASAQADLDVAEAALATAQADIAAINADNATQTELDAAQAAQDAAQALVDAAQDTLATTRQAAQDAIEAELDGIIANTGEIVAVGGRVLPLDDPRPYINNTPSSIILSGNGSADLVADGLTLDVSTADGLRGAPVADNAALTALTAKDYERRKVSSDGKEYVFELGAVSGTLADDAATGFWQEQTLSFEATKVDAGAGAFTETLAASTNSGTVRLFTNIDVANSATLFVQSGETLNGVTDGTFLFSNYTSGTQFRADEVAGGWVVSISGSTDQISLHSAYIRNAVPNWNSTALQVLSMTASNPATLAPANATISLLAPLDQFLDGMTASGNTIVAQQNGRYSVDATNSLAYDGNGLASFWMQLVKNGTDVVATTMMNNSAASENKNVNLTWSGNLNAGETLEMRVGAQVAVNVSVRGISIRVNQEPKTESVLAGMVEPTELSYYIAKRSADVSIDTLDVGGAVPFDATVYSSGSNIAFDGITGIFTLKAGSVYRLTANLAFTADGGELSDGYQFYNVDTASFFGVLGHYKDFTGDSSPKPSNPIAYISPTVDTQVILSPTGNVDNNTSDLQDDSWVEVQEVPSASIVMPDALPVESLSIALYTMSADSDPGAVSPSGPVTNFQRSGVGDVSNITENTTSGISSWTLKAGNRYRLTAQLRIASGISVATTYGWYDATGNSDVGANAFPHSANNASSSGSTDTAVAIVEPTVDTEYYVRENGGQSGVDFAAGGSWVQIEQVPTKAVINTVDTPVNDQAASGYFDIGAMRVQWGTVSVSSESAVTITLPAAFANTSYSVVGNAAVSNQGYAYALIPATTTTFTADRNNDGSDVAANMSYMAIGLKP